jgi:hypothetical protein
MPDSRELVDVLKAELAFLEQGGYRSGPRYPWRPNFVFEDSPTCINFKNQSRPVPCTECRLIPFVPEHRRLARVPCRHIPLTQLGETVGAFYEWGTEQELEAALRNWLVQTIQNLETESKSSSQSA